MRSFALTQSLLATGALCAALALSACNKAEAPAAAADPNAAPGEIGPDGPTSIAIPDKLDEKVAAADPKKGEELYASKGCKACHNLDGTKLVGPGFEGVGKRHTVAWMARMLLKPEEMVKTDPAAKKLLGTYMTAMANQQVDPDTELPHLLAFLKNK